MSVRSSDRSGGRCCQMVDSADETLLYQAAPGEDMSVRRPQQFVAGLVMLSLVGVLALTVADSLLPETVVLVGVVAALIAGEATAPTHVSPPWRRRLWLVLLAGLAAFVAVVGHRALELLPSTF